MGIAAIFIASIWDDQYNKLNYIKICLEMRLNNHPSIVKMFLYSYEFLLTNLYSQNISSKEPTRSLLFNLALEIAMI